MLDETLFKSFNDNDKNTKWKNRDKNKYQRNKKIGNNISDIYNLLIRNKMECYKEQYIKKEDKE